MNVEGKYAVRVNECIGGTLSECSGQWDLEVEGLQALT